MRKILEYNVLNHFLFILFLIFLILVVTKLSNWSLRALSLLLLKQLLLFFFISVEKLVKLHDIGLIPQLEENINLPREISFSSVVSFNCNFSLCLRVPGLQDYAYLKVEDRTKSIPKTPWPASYEDWYFWIFWAVRIDSGAD